MEKNQTEKLQELQVLEQNLQSIILQKQAFEMELADVTNALEELKKQKDDVYKIVGSLMVKAKKEEVERELVHKREMLELRLKNIEKQEHSFKEKSFQLREELMSQLNLSKKQEKL
jgi:prefoldin beta subunit